MRIQQKLSLWFSIASVCLLILFGWSIYFFTAEYRQTEFFGRLTDRVEITEKMFLEKERMPEQDYDRIRQQFLQTLPDETEEVFKIDDLDKQSAKYPAEFLERLKTSESAYFENEQVQGVGKVFHLPDGTYAVVLTAVDKVGIKKLDYMFTIIVLGLVAGVAVIWLVSYYLAGKIMEPISEKIKKANQISANNLHERLVVHDPDDEMGELATAFNKLLERIDSAFEAQKLFISNASHELKNPLAAIMGETELTLEKERSGEDYVRSLKVIASEAGQMDMLVHNLLQLSKISYSEAVVKFEKIDLQELLFSLKQKIDYANHENKVQLQFTEFKGTGGCFINGNWNLMTTALYNLLDNACKFSANQDVAVKLAPDGHDQAVIEIVDYGIGIPKGELAKITFPFFRASNVVNIKGSGIGIPLTHRIITLHKGNIRFESELGKGTCVTITIPLI